MSVSSRRVLEEDVSESMDVVVGVSDELVSDELVSESDVVSGLSHIVLLGSSRDVVSHHSGVEDVVGESDVVVSADELDVVGHSSVVDDDEDEVGENDEDDDDDDVEEGHENEDDDNDDDEKDELADEDVTELEVTELRGSEDVESELEPVLLHQGNREESLFSISARGVTERATTLALAAVGSWNIRNNPVNTTNR